MKKIENRKDVGYDDIVIEAWKCLGKKFIDVAN